MNCENGANDLDDYEPRQSQLQKQGPDIEYLKYRLKKQKTRKSEADGGGRGEGKSEDSDGSW